MGFSLIELMVALTIFSIVMVISLGTLLTLLDANTKAQALSSSMTNISFALDSITRNLRTGLTFYCAANASAISDTPNANRLHSPPYDDVHGCATGGEAIVFTPGADSSAAGTRIAYRLDNGQIEQWVDVNGETDGWVPITSNQPPGAVTIHSLRFILEGEESVGPGGDTEQPHLSVYILGTVDAGLDNLTEFRIQSNVTQRILNF